MKKKCNISGCTRDSDSLGMCRAHYKRWRKGKRGAELEAPLQYHNQYPPGQCIVEGCERKPTSRGMCHMHYKKWLRGTLKDALEADVVVIDPRSSTCSVPGCKRGVAAKGLCNAHYLRMRQGKSLAKPIAIRGAKDNVCRAEGCTNKVGLRGAYGYCPTHYKRLMRKLIWLEIIELKGGRCQRCGGEFPYAAYDLHHRDPKQKDFSIGQGFNRSREQILRESEKCDLLCANCHRVLHFGDGSEFGDTVIGWEGE